LPTTFGKYLNQEEILIDDLFRKRRALSFLTLCDDFIEVRMLAQKPISKWHGIRARVWPGYLAFGKAIQSNIRNATILCLAQIPGF
jgi:hypothetical protein